MNKSSKYISILSIFVIIAFVGANNLLAQGGYASKGSYYCKVGLEYERFTNVTLGTHCPVLLTVEPNSPAAIAGLKVGDFIEKINGQSTSKLSDDQINAQLLARDSNGGDVQLEVSNFGYSHKSVSLTPFCLGRGRLDESMLVDAFSFYSLEDASARVISYPFTTAGDSEYNYNDVKNYTFSATSLQASNANESAIVKYISEQLDAKGLKSNSSKADIVIDYYYTVAKNSHYSEEIKGKKAKPQGCYRYDYNAKTIKRLPLLNAGEDMRLAPYILTFGISIFDANNKDVVIWSSESVEFLTEEFPVGEYARMAIPTMLLQFPAVRYNGNLKLRVVNKCYNYTGVIYDANDMAQIAQIAKGSPAEKAGLKSGDRIISINGKFIDKANELTVAYRNFVKETIVYRDETTMFTDKKGVKHCRYWAAKDYEKIASFIAKKKYKTVFSYLFAFRPYIIKDSTNGIGNDKISFEINRNGELMNITVTPILLNNNYVSLD